MFRIYPLCSVGAVILALAGVSRSASGALADEPQPQNKPVQTEEKAAAADVEQSGGQGQSPFQRALYLPERRQLDIRFGYWGTHNSGSPFKTGEYQDLNPSPFYDVDGLFSNGERTVDLTVTSTDNEANNIRLNFYRPGFEANVDYERFLRRFGHDPFQQFTDINSPLAVRNAAQVVKEDLNVGEDYAIRVQELKGSFKGRLSDNLKVRLDYWGLEKEGFRQATALAQCFPHPNVPAYTGRKCHVLSQAQHIDWQTTEIKPVIEWDLGAVVVEYSRPMRTFNQDDSVVMRPYGGYVPSLLNGGSPFGDSNFPYAIVPDSFTQIDQVKISADLNDCNKLYTMLFYGTTHKESDVMPPGTPERENTRTFGGADLRWTNTAIENVTVTTYGRLVEEDNQGVSFVIPVEETHNTAESPLDLHPINYKRWAAGSKAVWRPFGGGFDRGGLAINGGYEYSVINRQNAEFGDEETSGVFNEDNTISNMFFFGPTMRWSPCFDTYARYKWYSIQDPLFAVKLTNTPTNSTLPTLKNIVEIGGTWMPADGCMINGWFGIDLREQRTDIANFGEQSYPFGINGWYALSHKWTLSGGYAYYTNFIDQQINLGDNYFQQGNPPSVAVPPLVTRWAYGSRAQVYNLGSTYCFTDRLRLVGAAEYVKAIESAVQTTGDPAVADLPSFIRQDVNTTRLTAGIDYQLAPRVSTYFRYVLFDYHDDAKTFNTGTSNAFLGGFTAMF